MPLSFHLGQLDAHVTATLLSVLSCLNPLRLMNLTMMLSETGCVSWLGHGGELP